MRRQSPEWFDAQYNNRLRVSQSEILLDRWARASQLVRDKMFCKLNLAYGSGPMERLDLFPSDVPKAPVLFVVHGGYWRSLDKSDYSFLASAFTDEGAMVIIPNFSLCPEVGIDRMALQLVQALAWVWRNAAAHGGDPNRIVLAGHSAGGHLATMLSCCDWKSVAPDLPHHLVKRVLSISGIHDLAPLRQTPFLQSDLKLDAEAVKRLSPIHFPAPDAPVYAIVGGEESEEFKRQTQLLRQAWGARSVAVCEELAGFNHFDILHDLADPEGRSHRLARKLLELRWYSALL